MEIIEVETAESNVLKELNENDFVNKQLASRMFESLDGGEFERAMLEKDEDDRYVRIKTGGKGKRDLDYRRKVLEYFSREEVERLLAACRFCTYLGGPGFPDLIILGHNAGFRYTGMELPPESRMFALIAKKMGLDVKIIRVVPKGSLRIGPVGIEEQELIRRFLSGKRYERFLELEGMIEEEKRRLAGLEGIQARQCRDEISCLQDQADQAPYKILRKWVLTGIEWADIMAEKGGKKEEGIILRLGNDPEFRKLPKGWDTETIELRRKYIMDKFGIGPTRAGEIIRRIG